MFHCIRQRWVRIDSRIFNKWKKKGKLFQLRKILENTIHLFDVSYPIRADDESDLKTLT